MKEIVLSVGKREGTGKESSHRLRSNGFIPGIVYGPETDSLSVSINHRELIGLIRREGRTNMLIDLKLEGENNGRKVVIREIQSDPVSGEFRHVDFYQVSMKRKLNTMIKVNLTGIPDGVKNAGGILQQVRREIEVLCLPSNIPEGVDIDVSELNIGDSIHIGDLEIDKVDIITEKRLTIATVVPPTVIKAAATEAEAEAEAEVEGEAEGEAAPEGEAAEGEKAEEKKEEKPAEK
jgi:large subunit ribosomal protein L25